MKSQNVFPRVDTLYAFNKSKFCKMITKEYSEDEDKVNKRKNTVKFKSTIETIDFSFGIRKKSGSILKFLEQRKSSIQC